MIRALFVALMAAGGGCLIPTFWVKKEKPYDSRSLKCWSVLIFECVLFFEEWRKEKEGETNGNRGNELTIWKVVNVVPCHAATDDLDWQDISAG